MSKRFTVGLTGGIASGKSVVASLLEELGAAVVDMDVIAREQTAPGMPALDLIAREFGPEIIAADGSLDRARLRERVFGTPAARKRLEAILHPRIRKAAWEQAATAPGSYLVMVIPLLAETGITTGLDRVLVIDAPREMQVERLRRRDGSTHQQAREILASQASRRQRRALADDVILNDAGLPELLAETEKFHRLYLRIRPSQGEQDSPGRATGDAARPSTDS